MKRKPSRKINLTKRSVDAVRTPKPGEKRTIIYDSQVRGLGVVCQPSSGSKSYFWFRRIAGTPTWRTIGSTDDLSVEQARRFAQDWNSKVAHWKASDFQGPAPLEERRDVTFGEAVTDYITRHLSANAKSPEKAAEYCRWQFDRYLAQWRARKLHSLRRDDCRDLHKDLGETAPIMANRILQLVRTVFNHVKREEMFAGENPAQGIRPFKERKRDRFLQPDELQRLFAALDSRATPRDLRDFVLLSLLCGARRSDTLSMRWDQLDLERGTWSIPDPKNQVPYIIPLVPAAVAIISKRGKQSDYVFPGVGASSHIVDLKRPWQALLKRARIENLRVHDLRRSLGSWMAGAGVSLPIIGKALGHQSGEATQIYARLALDPVRQAIAQATDAMLLAGKKKPQKRLKP